MRDLERELRELGAAIAVPATPDFAGEVRTRLPAARVARQRRRLVLALALLAVVLVGLAASPARTAILRFFGIGAVRIELVDRLPVVEPSAPIAAGNGSPRPRHRSGSSAPTCSASPTASTRTARS